LQLLFIIIIFIILKFTDNKPQNNPKDKKDNPDNGSAAGVEAGFTEPTTQDSNSSDYYDGNGYVYKLIKLFLYLNFYQKIKQKITYNFNFSV
jgi:hypothetical protein